MRAPADFAPSRPARPKRRAVIIGIVAVLVVLLFSVRKIAELYTDSLWFSSIDQHQVFSTVLTVKIGLFLVFGLVFFLAMWANLLLCNRLGPSDLFLDAPEDELVRRFHSAVRPYAGRLYALISAILAIVAAYSSVSQWRNYLLFANAQTFGVKDPLFGKDEGFYVFRLPFLTFVIDWALASLLAIIVFSVIFHYLNGGIRAARVTPRVSPGVKVHLSVLVALLALAKAAGYLVARWHMVTSTTNGVVEGAGYTDVHARIPALTLLFWLCLAAVVILLVNIWQRGWTLPVLAVGLWAFVALIVGVVYPAVLQGLKVTPAQVTLEAPYIQRNIDATRAAYSVENVRVQQFRAAAKTAPLNHPAITQTLAAVRQWDPAPEIAQGTYQQTQGVKNWYPFSQLGEDRYVVGGKLTPVNVGVRELDPSSLQNPTWVNQHLQYTHGYGIVVSPSNAVNTQSDHPIFDVGDIPTRSNSGFPPVTYPAIYFGLDMSSFVVTNSKAQEINYDIGSSTPNYATYTGDGGIPVGGWLRRAAFAIRFGDPNLFLSNLITSDSRIMMIRNVTQIAHRAAPFLSIDSHPYAVLLNGHVNWVLDGYTSTDQYAYSENANTQLVPGGNGLPGSYNYVRNSVKIVVDAYTGKVTLYQREDDPILRAWMAAFPDLVQPIKLMPTNLREHMKYPMDIFSIQAAIFGRYHIQDPKGFYSNGDGWQITPTDGVGAPSNLLKVTKQYDKQGFVVSQTASRMDPLYQIFALPGAAKPQYTLSDAYVTTNSASGSGSANGTAVLALTAFIVALNDQQNYGQLSVYRPPADVTITGPVQADSTMNSYQPASQKMTLLNGHGSKVLLGNILMIPINGQMLYVRPMYVTGSSNNFPLLRYLITVYGTKTGFARTLPAALLQVLGGNAGNSGGGGGGTSTLTARELLVSAQAEYVQAQAALRAGDLAAYQEHVDKMNADLQRALNLLGAAGAPAASTTTTTIPAAQRATT